MSGADILAIVGGLVIGFLAVYAFLDKRGIGAKPAPPPAPAPPPMAGDGACYRVLGVLPEVSDEGLREAYRRLIAQYHPDKVTTLGIELRELAAQRAAQINAAYDTALAQRGLRR